MNITNYIPIHSYDCIKNHEHYSKLLNNEFTDNVVYIYNRDIKDIDWIDNVNIIESCTNNKYYKYNKYIGRYSGLLYLLSHPEITKTDYMSYVSCGWYLFKISEFDLREDSITLCTWTVPDKNIYEEILGFNAEIRQQLKNYVDICNDEHFKTYCEYSNLNKTPFEIIPKAQFSRILDIVESKILPNIDTYIKKYPKNVSITEVLHMFFIHYNYYLLTNFRIVNGINVKRVDDVKLHYNKP